MWCFPPFLWLFSLHFLLLTYNYTSLRWNYAGYSVLDQETQLPAQWVGTVLSTVIPLNEIYRYCHFQKSCGPKTTYCIEDLMLFTFSYNYVMWGWEIHHKHRKTLFRLIELQPGEHLFRFLVESFFFLQLPSAQEPSVVFETVLLLCHYSRSFNFGWQTFFEKTI